jgi:lipid-A-disaccharide synthase-like uncharacterized protein
MNRGCSSIIPLIGLFVFSGFFILTWNSYAKTPSIERALWFFGVMVVIFLIWFVMAVIDEIDEIDPIF